MECNVGRTRASSNEWRRYYERADRARRRFSDPFLRIMRRRRLAGRVAKCGVACAAFAGFLVVIIGGLWLFSNVDWQTVADALTLK